MSEVGAPKQGLMNIGEEAKPPFAVLPDPSSLFLNRSKRLAALAPGHELAALSRSSWRADARPARHPGRTCRRPCLPPFEQHRAGAGARHAAALARAVRARRRWPADRSSGCSQRLAATPLPAGDGSRHRRRCAQRRRRRAPRDGRGSARGRRRRRTTWPSARSSLAGLQVHFARLAAMLAADDLKPVADGACPVVRQRADDELRRRLAEGAQHALLHLLAVRDHVERRARQVRAVQLDRRHQLSRRSRASPTRSRPRPATSAAAT